MIATIKLSSGMCLSLYDESRHYFGGYYHVRISASCPITLVRDYFDTDSDFSAAQTLLGPVVRFERILEKMAVPADDTSRVRSQLIEAFNHTTRHYLESPGFAKGFVLSEFQKRSTKPLNYLFSRT